MLEQTVGWLGVGFGLLVAPAQLIRILRTKCTTGISITTYLCLCLALVCYLVHALYIQDAVFITAQAVNITVNFTILVLLVRGKRLDKTPRREVK